MTKLSPESITIGTKWTPLNAQGHVYTIVDIHRVFNSKNEEIKVNYVSQRKISNSILERRTDGFLTIAGSLLA